MSAVPGPVVLEARGLSAGYGPIPVVKALDLSVRAGEIVTLLGANGAGKTTTLMALAGLLPPSQGEVLLLGRSTRAALHERSRAGMAYVPEQRGIFRNLSTMENLRLGRGDPELALNLMPELRPLIHRRAGLDQEAAAGRPARSSRSRTSSSLVWEKSSYHWPTP